MGVVEPVRDEPVNWLLAEATKAPDATKAENAASSRPSPAPRPHVAQIAPSPKAVPAPASMPPLPEDLATLDAWFRDSQDLPGSSWSARRVLPTGPIMAPILVLTDMPDLADQEAGHLLAGDVGTLFDAMLAAIGQQRAALRIGSIALTRPPGGRWDEENAAKLRAIALHHIRIAKPAAVLLAGQMTCRLITGQDVPTDGDGLRNINHFGATTATIAIHHPRLLLNRPGLKRGAWNALKTLREPA